MEQREKRPNIDLLQSVLHNSEIAVLAINYILPETNSENLKNELKKQRKEFKEIVKEAKQLGIDFNIELKPNNPLKKVKMWMSIKASSLFDDETQHIAELMVLGNFMGAVNMIKSLADASNSKEEILKLARKLKTIEENSINALVPFLERTKH